MGQFLIRSDGKKPYGFRLYHAAQLPHGRCSLLTACRYGGAEGATRYLGKMQYSVFAYEGYKILLLRVPPQEGLLSIRLPRDVNAEEVYLKIIHFLNAGSKHRVR